MPTNGFLDIGKVIGLEQDRNIALMKTDYDRKVIIGYKSDGSPMYTDLLTLTFKDFDTNEVIVKEIKNPKISAYVIKPQFEVNGDRGPLWIEKEKVMPFTFNYKKALTELADVVQKFENNDWAHRYVSNCYRDGKYYAARRIHQWNRFMSTDIDIEDFYIRECGKYFKNSKPKLSIAHLDIEVDTFKGTFDVNESTGTAPINIITLVDNKTKKVYTLALYNSEYEGIDEIRNNIEEWQEEIKEYFKEKFRKLKEGNKKLESFKFKYEFRFRVYDEELELIRDTFNLIKSFKYDYTTIWNMRFDLRYIHNRLSQLCDEDEIHAIVCGNEYEFKKAVFIKDDGPKNTKTGKAPGTIALRKDRYVNSLSTIFMDAMINYTVIRKHKTLPSSALDFIANIETKARKLPHVYDFNEFPYKDYKLFVKYNINDVLLMDIIEDRTNDTTFIFQKSHTYVTRQSKIFNETIFLRNYFDLRFNELGFILGNNHNIDYLKNYREEEESDETESGSKKASEKMEEKFEGAIVGAPEYIEHVGKKIHGRRSRHIFPETKDYDVGSEYPTNIEQANISPVTQIGRVIIPGEPDYKLECVGELDETGKPKHYDRGGAFIDDMEIQEPLLLGERWFGLDMEKAMEDFENDLCVKLINLKTL